MKTKEVSSRQISRRTWLSFSIFSISGILAWTGWSWLRHQPNEPKAITGGVPAPLRKVLDANGKIAEKAFNPHRLVKTFPKSMASKKVRRNGDIGLKSDLEDWKLQVKKNSGEELLLSLDDIAKLPFTDIVYDFKCIEGWDQISHWGGVKFSDFIDHFGLHDEASMEYVSLVTPDQKYYVGIDMPSAMHPQTLLCYRVNDQPLPSEHGYPLRLIIPVKYGVKNLKRIGSMSFSNERPPDYWAAQGYDYFSGL